MLPQQVDKPWTDMGMEVGGWPRKKEGHFYPEHTLTQPGDVTV